MANSRELMSASALLTELSSVKDGDEIRLPVVVNFDNTAYEEYAGLLKGLLRAKHPKAVVLYKWPETRTIDEKSLTDIFELLVDARIKVITLDVRNLSGSMLEDIYQKTKQVLSQITARPIISAFAMHHPEYWAWRFLKLVNLPLPFVLPLEEAAPRRPASTSPVSVTSHSLFTAGTSPSDLSASVPAYIDEPPPGFFDDEPPSLVEETPKNASGGYCSVM